MVERQPQPADDKKIKAQQRRRLDWRLAVAGLLVLGLLVVLLLACVLWIPSWLYPSLTETDLRGVPDAAKVQELKGARLKLQNDARTTLVQGLGAVLVLTGAGIGASVTLRQIRETATANRNQLQLGEQGQVTDRYATAVEQLGHEKAPVRLGALYSLEHLAQDNPEYRQTVVDVVCAYLRMPYTLPAQTELDAEQVEEMASPANGQERAPHPAPERDPTREELQVRQTAQRLLADHLRCPPQTSGQDAQLLPPSPQQAFWPGISVDLTGAVLVGFNFARVAVIQAQFYAASFHDNTMFYDTSVHGDATFAGATFQGDAVFYDTNFQGDATFSRASFHRDATFAGATFQGDALFHDTSFQREAKFYGASFHAKAVFLGTSFQAHPVLEGAQVMHANDHSFKRFRHWPQSYTVQTDPTDPTRGTLVSRD